MFILPAMTINIINRDIHHEDQWTVRRTFQFLNNFGFYEENLQTKFRTNLNVLNCNRIKLLQVWGVLQDAKR